MYLSDFVITCIIPWQSVTPHLNKLQNSNMPCDVQYHDSDLLSLTDQSHSPLLTYLYWWSHRLRPLEHRWHSARCCFLTSTGSRRASQWPGPPCWGPRGPYSPGSNTCRPGTSRCSPCSRPRYACAGKTMSWRKLKVIDTREIVETS